MTSLSSSLAHERAMRDFEPLLPAEESLLRAVARGKIAKISFQRPSAAAHDLTIRAAFLAFVAHGGPAGPTLDRPTVQVLGAWISGRLDLAKATIATGLWLYRCGFAATPVLDGARIAGDVSFPDCELPGLRAQDCSINGSLALNAGCTLRGPVRLDRATLTGDLDFERAQLCISAATPHALVGDGARIGGNLRLCGGFRAQGEVRFTSTHIGGDIRAGHASLTAFVDTDGTRGAALSLDDAKVVGTVFLDSGFSAAGQVRLKRSRIKGDLDCTEASFDALGDTAWDNGVALLMDHARVGGAIILRGLPSPLQGGSLANVDAGTLADDATTWGQRHVLDGFTYRRLGLESPTDAPMRLRWLARQHASHLGADHRPQPWTQLIAVLRGMGHHASASDVAIGRERHLRRIGHIGHGAPAASRGLMRLGHDLFGAFAGYGHRPLRLVGLLLAMWLLCSGLFWVAAEQGLIAPTNAAVLADPRLARCGANTPKLGADCPEWPANYPGFNPFVYSLDLMLPGLDLRQQRAWSALIANGQAGTAQALGIATLAAGWLEAVCGWIAAITLFVSVTGLTDRDRRS